MDERFLFISPELVRVAVSPQKKVGLLFDYENEILGLAPGLKLAVELTPQEAIDLADKLLRKASEVLGGSSQQSLS